MASLANSRKDSAGENCEQETRPANEIQREQQPMETRSGSNQVESSDQDTMNHSELESNSHYLSTDHTTIDDRVNLTDNRSPSPISPEKGTGSGSIHQKPHKELVLTVSQESHVSVPINEEHRSIKRKQSVVTSGGRVIRNISMNNSVKHNIGSAYEKHPSVFSGYKNTFRSDPIKGDVQHAPSLRRDGQKRRVSSTERTKSERSLSTSSDDVFINGKKNSKFLHQESTDSCASATSNTQLVSNPYNDFNHKISSVIWCPCFFFFCFGCSLPGFQLMRRSDTLFNDGDYNKARTYANVATFLYVLGMILSIAFWVAIFVVILYFSV